MALRYTDEETKHLRNLVKQDTLSISKTVAAFRDKYPHRPEGGVTEKVRLMRKEVFPERYSDPVERVSREIRSRKRTYKDLVQANQDLVDSTRSLLAANGNPKMHRFLSNRVKEAVDRAAKAQEKVIEDFVEASS